VIKTVTPHNYKEDPLYRRVVKAVAHLQNTRQDITPLAVLHTLGMLTPQAVDEWREGRVPYLEAVLKCNLSQANRILRILRLHALELNLRVEERQYRQIGRSRLLQFTRAGDPNIERAYARLYSVPGAA
jgi:hypothetical protein